MKLKPVNNKIIIKKIEEEEQRFGNIIIPDVGNETPFTGNVIAVGRGTYTNQGVLIESEVKVGDKVAFTSFSGVKFVIDGEELICLTENDILTIIE
jgi:chaperonin GroES